MVVANLETSPQKHGPVFPPVFSVFQQFLNQSLARHYDWAMDKLAFRFLWSTIASLLVLGATAGALLLPKMADSIEMFAFERFLCGVGFGISTGIQGLYLTEISPIPFRGFIGMFIGTAICVGFFLGSITGLPQYIEVVPTMLLLIFLQQVKESPTYLMDMGNADEARKSIQFYHGKDADVGAVLKDIEQELSVSKDQWSLWQIWRSRPIRNAALIAIVLNIAVSFSGIMVFDFFGTLMLKNIGLSDEAAGYANAGWSAIGIPAAIISSILVEHAGRRFLALAGLGSLAALNVPMLVVFYAETGDSFLGYLFLLCLMLFYIVFSISVGPLVWFIGPELSPHHARNSVQAVAIAVHYISSFLSPIIYFPLEQLIGPFSFFWFIVPLIATAIYCYWRMPESKNRHITEIMIDLGATDFKQNRPSAK